jgi:HK97 family phage portal protein
MRIGPFSFFEKKDVGLANPDPALLALFGAGPEGTISRAQAMTIPAVSAAIRAISEAAATLGVNVVRVEDGVETPDNEHPVAKLLHADVNDWTSGFELLRDLIATALTNDNGGMAWVNRVDGKPQEIIIYRTGVMAVAYEDTGEPKYSINARSLNRDDVIHVRSPFNQCPLSLAMRAISVSWHLESHALNLFKKGARPGGVIEFPKMLGDEGLKKMRAGWRAAFGGSENAGDTAVLWDGAKFVPMTLNSTDAQFLENRKFQVLEICRAFRVPPSMLFELDRATWSNGEQQGKEFLTYCLEPWLHALEVAMRRALFTPEERSQYKIVFDRDDLTRADLATRAAAINSLIASETINPNTGRDWLNLPPYVGGETYGNRNITVDHAKPPAKPAEPLKVAA